MNSHQNLSPQKMNPVVSRIVKELKTQHPWQASHEAEFYLQDFVDYIAQVERGPDLTLEKMKTIINDWNGMRRLNRLISKNEQYSDTRTDIDILVTNLLLVTTLEELNAEIAELSNAVNHANATIHPFKRKVIRQLKDVSKTHHEALAEVQSLIDVIVLITTEYPAQTLDEISQELNAAMMTMTNNFRGEHTPKYTLNNVNYVAKFKGGVITPLAYHFLCKDLNELEKLIAEEKSNQSQLLAKLTTDSLRNALYEKLISAFKFPTSEALNLITNLNVTEFSALTDKVLIQPTVVQRELQILIDIIRDLMHDSVAIDCNSYRDASQGIHSFDEVLAEVTTIINGGAAKLAMIDRDHVALLRQNKVSPIHLKLLPTVEIDKFKSFHASEKSSIIYYELLNNGKKLPQWHPWMGELLYDTNAAMRAALALNYTCLTAEPIIFQLAIDSELKQFLKADAATQKATFLKVIEKNPNIYNSHGPHSPVYLPPPVVMPQTLTNTPALTSSVPTSIFSALSYKDLGVLALVTIGLIGLGKAAHRMYSFWGSKPAAKEKAQAIESESLISTAANQANPNLRRRRNRLCGR